MMSQSRKCSLVWRKNAYHCKFHQQMQTADLSTNGICKILELVMNKIMHEDTMLIFIKAEDRKKGSKMEGFTLPSYSLKLIDIWK
ncbi:hypothetical protein HOLleu_30037 [Holothuria leucospilota]|uniref:Uncharacterized protein n=1 Tax=Holothuria leucospilota TaxID=206669 RepID=A0A9Q1BJT0_HOLLE|nr:hypothetical protein HOLleu_30037 [Holothuria leucospilota]